MYVSRETRTQKFHLVGKYVVIGQIEELILIRHEWYGQKLHICLFWRTVGFSIITTSTGCNDIGPYIDASPGEWLNMISREIVNSKLATTVETDIFVTTK